MRKIVVHDALTPLLNECYYTDQNKSGLFNAAQHVTFLLADCWLAHRQCDVVSLVPSDTTSLAVALSPLSDIMM